MSLEPLRITGGRKFADGLATITAFTSMATGFTIPPLTLLLFDTSEPLGETVAHLALNLLCVLAFVLVGQLLIGLALGRPHTGGSRSRFFRYQLGSLGFGAGLGFGFAPAMFEAATPWWIVGITTGVLVGGLSLLVFRNSGRRPLHRPPHPGIALADGVVVDYWNGAMGYRSAPQLAVVRFADERGRARFVRHLVQRSPTDLGSMGQVQFDRRRPERVLRFTVGRPPHNHPDRGATRHQGIPPRNLGTPPRNRGTSAWNAER